MRLLVLAAALVTTFAGCGKGTSCPVQVLTRHHVEQTVQCCGAASWEVVTVSVPDAELDLAFAAVAGAPAHAWLTTPDCERLFDGDYPPATGAPSPLCATYLGPVSAGEVSPRRKLGPGTYRVWVQAFSSSPQPLNVAADVQVWGQQCGGAAM